MQPDTDVLVVDDDFMVARIHAGFVNAEPGFRVAAVARNAAEAVASVQAHRPQLVLLDIHLPDTNGLDLLQRLREISPELDAIVITAAREQETVSRALRGGVVSYLMKPFAREDLARRLVEYRERALAIGAGDGPAEQGDVDRLFGLGTVPAPRGSGPRKGLSGETLGAIEAALKASGTDLSASETAERVGISRVSARRYLEHLAESGAVVVDLRYGAGRPERRYSWRR